MDGDEFEGVFDAGGDNPRLPVKRHMPIATIPGQKTRDHAEAESAFYPDYDFDGFSEDEKAERQERQDDVRETVAAAMATGYTPEQFHDMVVDPVTDKPMTLARFRKVFAKEIENGGMLANVNMMKALYGIGAKGKGGKGAAAQVKAIAIWLERREVEKWRDTKNLRLVDETTDEVRRKAEEALDEAKKAMAQMADQKRAMAREDDAVKVRVR